MDPPSAAASASVRPILGKRRSRDPRRTRYAESGEAQRNDSASVDPLAMSDDDESYFDDESIPDHPASQPGPGPVTGTGTDSGEPAMNRPRFSRGASNSRPNSIPHLSAPPSLSFLHSPLFSSSSVLPPFPATESPDSPREASYASLMARSLLRTPSFPKPLQSPFVGPEIAIAGFEAPQATESTETEDEKMPQLTHKNSLTHFYLHQEVELELDAAANSEQPKSSAGDGHSLGLDPLPEAEYSDMPLILADSDTIPVFNRIDSNKSTRSQTFPFSMGAAAAASDLPAAPHSPPLPESFNGQGDESQSARLFTVNRPLSIDLYSAASGSLVPPPLPRPDSLTLADSSLPPVATPALAQNPSQTTQVSMISKRSRRSHDEISFSDLVFGEKIGEGSFGTVHKGVLWNQEVAIKRIRLKPLKSTDNNGNVAPITQPNDIHGDNADPNDPSNPNVAGHSLPSLSLDKIIRDFRKEVKIMRTLRHPNIVEFLGIVAESPENLCIVTELLENGSLEDAIVKMEHEGKRYSLKRIVNLAKDIIKGLNWLHHKKIIHRDIKSSNILLDADFHAKIGDFGLSHVRTQATVESTGLYGRVGSPCYTAPEVLKGLKYNYRADIFSFGIILAELLNGKYPYDQSEGDSASTKSFEQSIMEGRRPIIPEYTPDKMKHLLERIFDSEPSNRPELVEIMDCLLEVEKDLFSEKQTQLVSLSSLHSHQLEAGLLALEEIPEEIARFLAQQKREIDQLATALRKQQAAFEAREQEILQQCAAYKMKSEHAVRQIAFLEQQLMLTQQHLQQQWQSEEMQRIKSQNQQRALASSSALSAVPALQPIPLSTLPTNVNRTLLAAAAAAMPGASVPVPVPVPVPSPAAGKRKGKATVALAVAVPSTYSSPFPSPSPTVSTISSASASNKPNPH